MDGADEACTDERWKCPVSKTCIDHNSYICDGDMDCPDGEDEENCLSCSSLFTSTFHCKNESKCLSGALVCNGKNDCMDGSDESGCSNYESVMKLNGSEPIARAEETELHQRIDILEKKYKEIKQLYSSIKFSGTVVTRNQSFHAEPSMKKLSFVINCMFSR